LKFEELYESVINENEDIRIFFLDEDIFKRAIDLLNWKDKNIFIEFLRKTIRFKTKQDQLKAYKLFLKNNIDPKIFTLEK